MESESDPRRGIEAAAAEEEEGEGEEVEKRETHVAVALPLFWGEALASFWNDRFMPPERNSDGPDRRHVVTRPVESVHELVRCVSGRVVSYLMWIGPLILFNREN